MGRTVMILIAALGLLTSCGSASFSSSSEHRFKDGIYSSIDDRKANKLELEKAREEAAKAKLDQTIAFQKNTAKYKQGLNSDDGYSSNKTINYYIVIGASAGCAYAWYRDPWYWDSWYRPYGPWDPWYRPWGPWGPWGPGYYPVPDPPRPAYDIARTGRHGTGSGSSTTYYAPRGSSSYPGGYSGSSSYSSGSYGGGSGYGGSAGGTMSSGRR